MILLQLKKFYRFFVLLTSLLVLLGLGCSVETQKARESFENGLVASEIKKLANQDIELRSLKSEIISRLDSDAKQFTLPVAVIDNGVDLAHPDLVNRFIYQIQNNEIISVGKDFMGDDNFASSSLINPELFALTATKINNGLIQVGTRNPFEFLIKHNDLFTKHFLNNFKSDLVLQNSIFAKLDSQSFDVFGLYKIYLSVKSKAYFDLEIYTSKKSQGLLLSSLFRDEVKSKPELGDEWSIYQIHSLLDVPFWNKRNSGLATPFENLSTIEHGDRLNQLVIDSFNSYPYLNELSQAADSLVEFRVSRNQAIEIDKAAEKISAVSFMSAALEYHRQGVNLVDPLARFYDLLRNVKMSEADLNRSKSDHPMIIVNSETYLENFKTAEKVLTNYKNVINQIKLSATERFAKKEFDLNIKKIEKLNQFILNERQADFKEIPNKNFVSDFSSRYRKSNVRTNHPYLSAFSEDESHGTHVSGIIAKQNEQIRIYPIRVTTRSALVTTTEFKALTAGFKAEFKSWLAEPIVVKALYNRVPTLRFDFVSEPKTIEERTRFADLYSKALDEAIDIEFESGPLNFIFFSELESAISHVAKMKIKIANISLGSEQSQEIPRLSEINPDKDMPQFFRFLQFENAKFRLGKILTSEAKNSLYVIAAGNSGAWVDGKTRSALPVDLTSLFLSPFEDGAEFIAPNNHIKNILAVGSLNPDQDLSGFTNVLLGLKTPMIFADGEEILSPIKTTSSGPAQAYIREQIPLLTVPVSYFETRMLEVIKNLPEYKDFSQNDTFTDKITGHWGSALMFLRGLQSSAVFHLAAKYSDHRGKMSGTSMATPATVGVIADQVINFAKEKGVSADQIYDHAEFEPQLLIQRVINSGKALFPENPIFPFKKIDVRGKYQHGQQMQDLDLALKEITKE